MPKFSDKSLDKLNQADHHLVALFTTVIKLRDCTILESVRGKEKQNEYFRTGRSQLKFPESNHNRIPSLAIDVAPYFSGRGVSFNKYEVVEFGHYVLGVRDCMNLTKRIRWGGDWNADWLSLTDNEFLDAFHWEVVYK